MTLPKCEVCDRSAITKSSIIEDYYYKNICWPCYNKLMISEIPSSGEADYDRGRDAEEHEADMMQPYDGDGNISVEFIHLYPERSRQLWSLAEIEQALRS